MEGPRACTAEDFEETMALLNSIFRAGSDQRLQTDYPLIFRPSDDSSTCGSSRRTARSSRTCPWPATRGDRQRRPHDGGDHQPHGDAPRLPAPRARHSLSPRLSAAHERRTTGRCRSCGRGRRRFRSIRTPGTEAVGPQARGYLLNPNDYEVLPARCV